MEDLFKALNCKENLEEYFKNHQMDEIVNASQAPERGVNEMVTKVPYKPDLGDLYRLHRIVIELRRTTVLEFGVGWSSWVFANALKFNESLYKDEIKQLRRNNPFQLHAIDNEYEFVEIAKSRIPQKLKSNTFFHVSSVEMTTFKGRICTAYNKLPLVSPDLIYLDGPDQFNVQGEIAGWSTRHKDMMPMSCDLLQIEHYLTPGTIIVVDGRAANARFLHANFQRSWNYKYNSDWDQHFFKLEEPPLGKYNSRQLGFYNKGIVSDLF